MVLWHLLSQEAASGARISQGGDCTSRHCTVMNHPTVWPGPNFGVQHWLVAMRRRFAFWMWPAATRGAPKKQPPPGRPDGGCGESRRARVS